MHIDISSIVNTAGKSIDVDAPIELEKFSCRLGEFSFAHKSQVSIHLGRTDEKTFFIRGEGEVELLIPCDRCLEEVPTSIRFDIDRKLTIEDGLAEDEEMDETDYLIGYDLDVDQLVYAEILVNWPMKVLCRDDCKGICRVCGMNLNHGTCKCDRFVPDPRMAAIQDIFRQFKEV